MNPKLPLKPDPDKVLRLFREGHNTYSIARLLVATEPAVMRALIKAREAHRAKISSALSTQRKSPVEGQ